MAVRIRVLGLASVVLLAVVVVLIHPAALPWQGDPRPVAGTAAGCVGGAESDFNGDGFRDVAFGDPLASVHGLAEAGQVVVRYGSADDAGTSTTIDQDLAEVPGDAEAGDRFGYALAVYDANRDGCGDLVVGAPGEAIGDVAAGAAVLVYGSTTGLGKGPAAMWWDQSAAGFAGDAENGDQFGYALTAGTTAAGEPFAVVGVPGEDIDDQADAGMVHYLRGGINAGVSSGAGLAGLAETDDRVGASLTSTPHHVAIGSPGEAVGTAAWAGVVQICTHDVVDGSPQWIASLGQTDGEEPFDAFGSSVSMVPYRPKGSPAGQPGSLIVVGVPGEDLDGAVDAGLVETYRLSATGAQHISVVSAATTGVAGDPRAGDYFGQNVRVVNTAPAAEASPQTVQVAVGVPGRDVDGIADAGAVNVFGAVTDPISPADLSLDFRAPGDRRPFTNELYGAYLGANSQYLFAAGLKGGAGAVEVRRYPWAGLANGTRTPSLTLTAGAGGFPAGPSIGMGFPS